MVAHLEKMHTVIKLRFSIYRSYVHKFVLIFNVDDGKIALKVAFCKLLAIGGPTSCGQPAIAYASASAALRDQSFNETETIHVTSVYVDFKGRRLPWRDQSIRAINYVQLKNLEHDHSML